VPITRRLTQRRDTLTAIITRHRTDRVHPPTTEGSP